MSKTLLTLLALLMSVTSDYTCPISSNCIVNCSLIASDCHSGTINGMAADSLTVICNYQNSCQDTKILTPNSTSSTTQIICNYESACNNAELYYYDDATSDPTNHNIIINCTSMDNSCFSFDIFATNAGNIQYNCNKVRCYSTIIYAENANSVKINCDGPDSDTGVGCFTPSFSVQNVTTVDIKCTGYHGCHGIDVQAQNANSLIMYASQDAIYSSFYSNTIHGENVKNTYQVTCIGNTSNHIGCDEMRIYLPSDLLISDKFQLNCYGTGCYNIKLSSKGGFQTFSSSNILFNGCQQCIGDFNNCKGSWYIYCDGESNSKYIYDFWGSSSRYCNSNNCSCSTVQTAVANAYMDKSSDWHCIVPLSDTTSTTASVTSMTTSRDVSTNTVVINTTISRSNGSLIGLYLVIFIVSFVAFGVF